MESLPVTPSVNNRTIEQCIPHQYKTKIVTRQLLLIHLLCLVSSAQYPDRHRTMVAHFSAPYTSFFRVLSLSFRAVTDLIPLITCMISCILPEKTRLEKDKSRQQRQFVLKKCPWPTKSGILSDVKVSFEDVSRVVFNLIADVQFVWYFVSRKHWVRAAVFLHLQLQCSQNISTKRVNCS